MGLEASKHLKCAAKVLIIAASVPKVVSADISPLTERLNVGRVYESSRKVRLGDVAPSGILRFDALTRYTQDVSNDDTTNAGLDDDPGWVVRSTTVDTFQAATIAEQLVFATFCGALGKRWAERRLTVTGDKGAHYEVSTLWVCVNPATGQPTLLTDQFLNIYGEAAGDRKIAARLVHPKPDDFNQASLAKSVWPLRSVDFDVYGHVNNAAYWAVVEDSLAANGVSGAFRARIEYAKGVPIQPDVNLIETTAEGARYIWWLAGGEVAASAAIIKTDTSQ